MSSTTQNPAATGSVEGSGSTPSSDLRERTRYELDAEKTLKSKQIAVGSVRLAEKPGKGFEGDTEVETNLYGIDMRPLMVFRYDVSIVGIKGNGREVVFTRKFKDDALIANRRDCCREAILMFWAERSDCIGHAKCLYNDLQSIMYTLAPLCPGEKPMLVGYEFQVDSNKVTHGVFADTRVGKVKMHFKPILDGRGSFGMQLGDLSKLSPEVAMANRDLLQFLDIATSQEIFFRNDGSTYEHVHFSSGVSYAYTPGAFGFTEEDTVTFDENKSYLALGCHKSTHLIEGPSAGPRAGRSPALLVQPKKTPFHADCHLIEKVNALLGGKLDMDRRRMIGLLNSGAKGLFVKTLHNPENVQQFPIRHFDPRGAGEVTIQVDGKDTTVQEFFLTKYNLKLQYPYLPLVAVKMLFGTDKRENYYPIEVLQVMDNQRVTTTQQTPSMTSLSIRKCAIPPNIFKRQIKQTADSIHLWDSSFLEKAGISLTNNPLTIRGHQLPAPEVQTGDATHQRPQFDGAGPPGWKINKVLLPQAVIDGQQYTWAVVAFNNATNFRDQVNRNDLNKFLDMFQNQARGRNITLPPLSQQPVILEYRRPEDVVVQFHQASSNGIAFLLCIHGEEDVVHHVIKKCERDYEVISQCVKVNTVRNVATKGQRLTVDNVLNKTNVKLGGLNYTLPRSKYATDNTTLVIGFGTNHPGGGIGDRSSETDQQGEAESVYSDESHLSDSPPSVVGFAANVGPTGLPFDYVGDFLYQRARREERANVIEAIVGKCVDYFRMTRNGNLPERLILFRNGCSEGQFQSILKYEVPLAKHVLEEKGCGNAKITVLVPNKLQNVRFFNKQIGPQQKAPDQNIKPGLVVDTHIVHPVNCEFYLNSHRTLQGSARTPKYTLLYDDNNFELRELEQMSYHLCFGHQIINTPVSLPAPVYIANEYAKRGRNLFNQCNDLGPDTTFAELNSKLGIGSTQWMSPYRINA